MFKQIFFFQFDFENRFHGANFLAYPPVVAGGNRANTLHYINNNQIIKVKKGRQYWPSWMTWVYKVTALRDDQSFPSLI